MDMEDRPGMRLNQGGLLTANEDAEACLDGPRLLNPPAKYLVVIQSSQVVGNGFQSSMLGEGS